MCWEATRTPSWGKGGTMKRILALIGLAAALLVGGCVPSSGCAGGT